MTMLAGSDVDGVNVGPLAERDRDRWAELWQGYLAFYGATRPPDLYDHTWSRLMGRTPSTLFGLGVRRGDGPLLGIVHALLHDTAWGREPVCYLQDLFVAPEARGLGLGRRLIEAVAQEARARSCSRVYWVTQDTNETARRLYDRIGLNRGFIRYDLGL